MQTEHRSSQLQHIKEQFSGVTSGQLAASGSVVLLVTAIALARRQLQSELISRYPMFTDHGQRTVYTSDLLETYFSSSAVISNFNPHQRGDELSTVPVPITWALCLIRETNPQPCTNSVQQ